MTIAVRLTEAADHLDHLYEGSKHIPTDLIHDREFRVGLVRGDQPPCSTVAQFYYGSAAEAFLALGPAALPLLSKVLRDVASETAYYERINSRNPDREATRVVLPVHVASALALADHILKSKES